MKENDVRPGSYYFHIKKFKKKKKEYMDTRVPSSTEIHTVVVVLLKLHVLNGKKKKILFIHHLFLGLESIAQSTMLSVG